VTLQGLQDKVAIVTAGAMGIGGATSDRLAQEGAKVVIVDIDEAAAQAAAERVGGDARVVVTDASSEDGVQEYVAAALNAFGRIDMALLNVGVGNRRGRTGELDVDDYDRVLGVTLRGNFLGLRAILTQMVEQGSGGSVVMTSSLAGVKGGPGAAAYTAAKHGVVGLVRTAAAEYAVDEIRVNGICPGFVDTELLRRDLDAAGTGTDLRSQIEQRIPLGRFARPEEIASTAAWLLSAESSYVTGETIIVDGAMTCAV